MSIKTSNQNINWFIDTVLLNDVKNMICTHGLHYIGFGTVACGIEFLGACIDAPPFDAQNLSRPRFESGIKVFYDAKYHQYADKNSQYDLYKHLRCGMAHIMRPPGRIAFTYQAESVTEGTKHLQVTKIDKTDLLVLVSEAFYTDFAEACERLKRHMAAGAYSKKLTDVFLWTT